MSETHERTYAGASREQCISFLWWATVGGKPDPEKPKREFSLTLLQPRKFTPISPGVIDSRTFKGGGQVTVTAEEIVDALKSGALATERGFNALRVIDGRFLGDRECVQRAAALVMREVARGPASQFFSAGEGVPVSWAVVDELLADSGLTHWRYGPNREESFGKGRYLGPSISHDHPENGQAVLNPFFGSSVGGPYVVRAPNIVQTWDDGKLAAINGQPPGDYTPPPESELFPEPFAKPDTLEGRVAAIEDALGLYK